MSLFGRGHDKKRDTDKDKESGASPEAESEATDAVAEGMLTASGGEPAALAQLITEHKLQRDRRLWHFLQRRLGNRKSAEVQQEIESPTTKAKSAEVATPEQKASYGAFCGSFSTRFASLLGGLSGPITEATVASYFTATQIALLTEFISTNVVPPNLFHQASGPKLTAQDRILISGVILAEGTLPPALQGKVNLGRDTAKGSERDDRLHAAMCGHWAQQVLMYAAAANAAYNQQTTQSVDSGGTLHLGNATGEKTFGSHDDTTGLQLQGKQKKAKETQDEDEAKARAEAEAAGKPYVVPKGHQEFERKAEMGDDAFTKLRPGDWIYIYNANTTASGQHSEIFISWADDTVHTDKASGVKYKTANVMSQLQVEDGGKVHKQKLGAAYAPGIATVTAINRVTANSSDLLDVHSLVAADAVEKNTKIIEEQHLDSTQLHHDLAKLATKELAALVSKKLDPAQQEMFQKAIAEASADSSPAGLALLVACVQRLDLSTGGVFKGRPANGIIDAPILEGKKTKKK